MDASTWEAVGGMLGGGAALTALFLPAIKRGVGRRRDRKDSDLLWSGRVGVHGLPDILPMWQRMKGVEEGQASLKATVDAIDERTKTLEPDGNGGHSTYDLVRKLAEMAGIPTGEAK